MRSSTRQRSTACLFLVLDGTPSLLWGATQEEGTESGTQDLFREWMHVHSCKPKWVVSSHPYMNKVTMRDLIRECCWARNTTLTISGYTFVELAHLEARRSADLRRDLARSILPSDAHGGRLFVWIDDKAKYKAVGRWARARVISQNGAIVTVETDKAALRVNQSKVRRDHALQKDQNVDYVVHFAAFMAKVKKGSFSTLWQPRRSAWCCKPMDVWTTT